MSYLLVEGSGTGHCCFEFTITKHDGEVVCEFLDEEDANDTVCKLNNYDKLVGLLSDVLETAGDSDTWDARCDEAMELLKELGHET